MTTKEKIPKYELIGGSKNGYMVTGNFSGKEISVIRSQTQKEIYVLKEDGKLHFDRVEDLKAL